MTQKSVARPVKNVGKFPTPFAPIPKALAVVVFVVSMRSLALDSILCLETIFASRWSSSSAGEIELSE